MPVSNSGPSLSLINMLLDLVFPSKQLGKVDMLDFHSKFLAKLCVAWSVRHVSMLEDS